MILKYTRDISTKCEDETEEELERALVSNNVDAEIGKLWSLLSIHSQSHESGDSAVD